MGTRTFVGTTPSSAEKPRRNFVDMPLLLSTIALCAFGLVMVFSASWDFSMMVYDGDALYMFNRQIMWMVAGAVVAFVFSRVDYHHLRTFVVPMMLATVLLLLGVLFFGEVRLGAERALLGGSIQPSELAKLITVIYLSVWLYSKRQHLHNLQLGLIPLGIILGIVGALIVLQPDYSAAGTIFILGGLLFFLAGGDIKQIASLLVLAVFTGWVVVQVSVTVQVRFDSYVAGIQDPTQSSYHMLRAFEAIVNGGWLGVGLGLSKTKLLGLPVPPTDSIFAVIAEELGVLGAVFTVSLYGLLIWRGYRVAQKAPDMLGSLLAAGLTFWLALEAAINMLVMVGLLPFAGNALPFISAGGSNLVASLAAVGILMNISRQAGAAPVTEESWRAFNATVDLRRRNGWRRVSRPGRPSGADR